MMIGAAPIDTVSGRKRLEGGSVSDAALPGRPRPWPTPDVFRAAPAPLDHTKPASRGEGFGAEMTFGAVPLLGLLPPREKPEGGRLLYAELVGVSAIAGRPIADVGRIRVTRPPGEASSIAASSFEEATI